MGREKGTRCLVALSREPLPGATSEVFPGLWHVSDFGAVRPEHEPHLSVFVGYCGWMDGQLNAEVQAGGWQVAAASADPVNQQWAAVPLPARNALDAHPTRKALATLATQAAAGI